MNLPTENIIEFIVLFSGGVGVWLKLNTKITEMSSNLKNLKEDHDRALVDNKDRILSLESKQNESHGSLDHRLTQIERDMQGISSDIGEIKGYFKAIAEKLR
jgi:hypothetical protein